MKRTSIAATAALSLVLVVGAAAQKKVPPKDKPAPEPEVTAEENYKNICQPCHGIEGKSPLPNMSLADGEWKHGSSTKEIAKTITEGVPGTAMLPNKDKLSKEEILALAKLVRSFDPKLRPEK